MKRGYVACDINCKRVKIKSPQYVLAHYTKTNNCISSETLLSVALSGETEKFLTYAAEYAEPLQKAISLIKTFKNDCVTALNELKSKNLESRKDYTLEVKKYPQRIQPYLFINFDNKMSIDNFTSE